MTKKKLRRTATHKSSTTKKVAKRSWFSLHPLRTAAIIIALGALFFGITRANGGLLSYFGAEPASINVATTFNPAMCQGDPVCLATYQVSKANNNAPIAQAEPVARKIVAEAEKKKEENKQAGQTTTPVAPTPTLSPAQVTSMCQGDPTCQVSYSVSTSYGLSVAESEQIVRKNMSSMQNKAPKVLQREKLKFTPAQACANIGGSRTVDKNSSCPPGEIDRGLVLACTKYVIDSNNNQKCKFSIFNGTTEYRCCATKAGLEAARAVKCAGNVNFNVTLSESNPSSVSEVSVLGNTIKISNRQGRGSVYIPGITCKQQVDKNCMKSKFEGIGTPGMTVTPSTTRCTIPGDQEDSYCCP